MILACPDWWDRLKAGKTPIPDLELANPALAEKAIAILNRFRLPDVIGQPTIGTSSGAWLADVARPIFGSVDQTGRRLIGESFVLIPKKNAKTTGAAGVALSWMLLNERRNADALIVGPTQKIAETAFRQAAGMIDADPWLSKRFHVQDSNLAIVDRKTNARLQIKTFSMDVLTGAKPVFVLIDELHILGGVAGAADVIRQIRGGMLPFPESHLMMISTQSDHPPAGVFKSVLQYARGVRDGRISEGVRLLPVLFEFPEDVQTDPERPWLDPEMWRFVTPNLGRSVHLEDLIDLYRLALQDGDGEVAAWATQHLNVEVGLALHSDRWAGADHWQAAAEPGLTLESFLERVEVVVAGVDGGGLDDLYGLGLVGRCRKTRHWLHWGRAWAQKIALKRRKNIKSKIEDLAVTGDLVICETPTQDIAEIVEILSTVLERGLFPEEGAVGLDPYGVAALIDELIGAGFTEDQMVAVPQGTRLSSAVWGAERKLADGTLRHADQPLMAWCVGNAVPEQRGNATLITKQTAGKSKIDPLIAMFNALMLMARNPEAAGDQRTPWDLDPNFSIRRPAA